MVVFATKSFNATIPHIRNSYSISTQKRTNSTQSNI